MSVNSEAGKRALAHPAEVTCIGKVPFDSHHLATQVLRRNSRKKQLRRSAYRCNRCGKWHLGTDAGRVQKRKAADLRRTKLEDRGA